jgi:hypothetical protein
MAAGSLLALVALLSGGNPQPLMVALAGGLAVGLFFAVLPPVFSRLTTWSARSFQRVGAVPVVPITYATWFKGFFAIPDGWQPE